MDLPKGSTLDGLGDLSLLAIDAQKQKIKRTSSKKKKKVTLLLDL